MMKYWTIFWFSLFILIAYANLRILLAQLYENKNASFAPFFGLIFFFLGMSGLEKDYNRWIWLLVLLDIGTLVLLYALPFVLRDWFVCSRFCRYRVYQNDTQILTLYQFKQHRSFDWEYIGETKPEKLPVLSGFGGEWEMIDDELYLNDEVLAHIKNDELVFAEIDDESYARLSNQRLKRRK